MVSHIDVGNAILFGLLAIIAIWEVACGDVPFRQSPVYVFLSQLEHLRGCIVVTKGSELRAKVNLRSLVLIATLINFVTIVLLLTVSLIVDCLILRRDYLTWWHHLLW